MNEYYKKLALMYLEKYKWCVLPAINKWPVLTTWKEYQYKLPTKDDIDRWFEEYKDRITGLALICGALSDITVLDFDLEKDKNGNVIVDSELNPIVNKLPKTCISETGSGGLHALYKYYPKLNGIKNLDSRIDIKTEGGLIILPPSLHESGNKYKWKVPPENGIATLDDSILKYIKDRNAETGYTQKNWSFIQEGSSKGNRNNDAASLAGKLLKEGSKETWDLVIPAALREWNKSNNPVLPDRELMATYESVKRKESIRLNNIPHRTLEDFKALEKEEKIIDTTTAIITAIDVVNLTSKFLFDPRNTEDITTGYLEVDRLLGGIYPSELIIFAGNAGTGKCHGKGTKILMYNGSIKNVEDIIVGDQIMGNDSEPRNVLSLVRGKDQMYLVKNKYKRGNQCEPYIVNESHILSCIYNNNKKKNVIDISVKDYLKMPQWRREHYYGYKTGISFKDKKVDIDPYFLGLWLGDGNSRNTGITSADKEAISFLYKYAKQLNLNCKKWKGCNQGLADTYAITGKKGLLLHKLFDLNLKCNKHIPDLFKINSEEKRLNLLAGLLDSDGYLNKDGTLFEITQKSKKLSDDIIFLARSLGFGVSIREKIAMGNKYYRMFIWGDLIKIPTKIKRKKAKVRKIDKNPLHYTLEIKKLKKDDYYGFALDGNSLYVLEDFTVTHNSEAAFSWALSNCSKINTLFISGEMQNETLLTRYIQSKADVSSKDIITQEYNGQEIKLKAELRTFEASFGKLKFINREHDLSVGFIEKVIVDNNFRLIFIDHLRYIKRESQNQFEALDNIVTSLQQIGQKHKCVIVLLAHYVKDNMYDGSKPQIIDKLYGGVSIQREATKVLQIWHKPLYSDDGEYNNPIWVPTRFLLQKNRYGEEGNAWMKYSLVKNVYESMTLAEIQEARNYKSTFSAKKHKEEMIDTAQMFGDKG